MSFAPGYLDTLRRELPVTRKVLAAFPATEADFRPHPRSSTARQLAWTFVIEARLVTFALEGTSSKNKGFIPPPASWGEILTAFDAQYAEVVRLAGALGSGGTPPGPVPFFVAAKTPGEIPLVEFLWFMLHDQIHHRGQMTVYLRMAGGKVPSIYGPSADEPWS